MTDHDKIIELATLDGWTNIHDNKYGVPTSGKTPIDWKGDGFVSSSEDYILPQYLERYDYIIPLIQKMYPPTKRMFIGNLVNELVPGQYQWDATPRQLCDAVLITYGKEI